MINLRQWALDENAPRLYLSADARLCETNYLDDQVWEFVVGSGEKPACALQTRYGGRAGLASIVPLWTYNGRAIYEAQSLTQPVTVTAFAPNYVQAQAEIVPGITVVIECLVLNSHTLAGQFALHNTSKHTQTLRLDLVGDVTIRTQELTVGIEVVHDDLHALTLGRIGDLRPIVLLEGGTVPDRLNPINSKVGVGVSVDADQTQILRWVHVGLSDRKQAVQEARQWLSADWDTYLQQIDSAASAIPIVKTGKDDVDLAIALSHQQLLQSLIGGTGHLPNTSFVAARTPTHGFSKRGDGTDYVRTWDGQDPLTAQLVAQSLISVDLSLAQDMIHNYLSVQQQDGYIDQKPGLAGQRRELLCLPILAKISGALVKFTGDTVFAEDVFPKLLTFFERWFDKTVDADSDGFPEWQHGRQAGYVFFPTFAASQSWGQGANVSTVEAPDLAMYLLLEGESLRYLAGQVKADKAILKTLDDKIVQLRQYLDSLWSDGRYTYRDRDTHQSTTVQVVLQDGQGDAPHNLNIDLTRPGRLLVRVVGGVSHEPRITLRIDGLDANTQPVTEEADTKAFVWGHGFGVYTTQQVFSRVSTVTCAGLSRVYRYHVQTVDYTSLDMNGVLPLCADVASDNVAALVKRVTDKKQFLRPNGITMIPANDSRFDPSNANGAGGVWPYWNALLIEGLLRHGHTKEAVDVFRRLLDVQTQVLHTQREFSEFYHSDDPVGLGEQGHLNGIVPVYLLETLIGVRIMSAGRVWVGGDFAWGKTITVQQHGVVVKRTSKTIDIRFPSGKRVKLKQGEPFQEIVDEKVAETPTIERIAPPMSKKSIPIEHDSEKPIIIDVEYDDD